ncbi:MAG: hypothetical protein V8S58_09525 [Lachnospiraceae bacterium]
MNRQDFEQQFEAISDQIWEFAETRYQEFRSSALQADFLEKEGFTVTRNLGGIATAFSASFGSGHPVIGLLGSLMCTAPHEQAADVPEKQAERPGAAGHGCGHNLLEPAPCRRPASSATGFCRPVQKVPSFTLAVRLRKAAPERHS